MLGLLGKKLGMTQIFDKDGKVVPVTVIEAGPCFVIQKKSVDPDGYTALQIGFGKGRGVNKPLAGHVQKSGVKEAPRYLREIRLPKVDEYQVGQEINLSIFKEGESVDVSGTSIGKGFAGTVKRHHFNRGPMTHGSKSHRIPGSSGAGSRPGRVLPGTRRAGRMGNERVTVKNLKVAKIDAEKNLLLLRGAVPGADTGLLLVSKRS
jgi:large subunit ribosomal protein L3